MVAMILAWATFSMSSCMKSQSNTAQHFLRCRALLSHINAVFDIHHRRNGIVGMEYHVGTGIIERLDGIGLIGDEVQVSQHVTLVKVACYLLGILDTAQHEMGSTATL